MKRCPNCGMENEDDSMFCGSCGASLSVPTPAAPKEPEKKLCPSCGMANDSTSLFCESCGAPLSAPASQSAFSGNSATPQGQFSTPQGQFSTPQSTFPGNSATPQGQFSTSQSTFPGNSATSQGQFSTPPSAFQGSYTAQPEASFPMKWHKFLIYFALWASALMNVVNGLSTLGNDALYSRIDGLESLNGFYCMVLIALAVLCIVTRFQLAGLKRMGPRLLLGIYAANLAVSFLYMLMAYTMMQNSGVYIVASDLMSGANWVLPVIMIIANYIYYKKRAALFVN